MVWSPSPRVSDCRDIAWKWDTEQTIIIGINAEGQASMATYGRTRQLCTVAKKLGDVAFNAVESFISSVANNTIGDK